VIITTRVCARAGLLGNPSDMYGGKVISFLIRNFSARVRLWDSPHLTLLLHPQHDRFEFAGLDDLVASIRRHGYYGMQRVLSATCRRFSDYCRERGLPLRKANFTLEYDTDIPRQSGMGGSSAIIIAALRALMRFYRLPARAIPPAELAALALSVETQELGITAGLQDRVVQVYGGLTYMDFGGPRPRYQRMNSKLLPAFGLAYLAEEHLGGLESGRVHAPMRFRWERGDPEVKQAMRAIAQCAEKGREALRRHDTAELGRLMDRNHDLRRRLYGDAGPEAHNLALVQTARAAGFPAKLPGSGGAALILLTGHGQDRDLAESYLSQGYKYVRIRGQ